MILVFTHENNLIVENARNLLIVNNIQTELRNEFAAGALGELSAFDTWPEIWVDEEHFDRAKKIIKALVSPIEGNVWQCRSCKEVNEPTFQLCWNCQSDSSSI